MAGRGPRDHEPLQSLLALHGREGDASRRYLERMQAALQLCTARPRSAKPWSVGQRPARAARPRHLPARSGRQCALCRHRERASQGCESACEALADPLKLGKTRSPICSPTRSATVCPGSPITLTLSATESEARIEVRNQGPPPSRPTALATLFELGTSDAGSQTQRGQGPSWRAATWPRWAAASRCATRLTASRFALTLPLTARRKRMGERVGGLRK